MSQRTESQKPLSGEQFDFEELLLEISTLFISLPVESVDKVIEDTQRKVCEGLDLDLSALWQWSDKDANLMTITHLYTIPGGPRPQQYEAIDASKTFPWVYSRMLAGEILAYSNEDLTKEAATDRVSRDFYHVESSVNIPLIVAGQQIIGIITFDTLKRVRQWSDIDVKRLKLVGDVFANALIRQQAERSLVESEARLNMAAESAEAGLWELNCRTGVFWATAQAFRIFGYQSEETISMARFEESVYSDDLGMVRQAIADSFEKREKLDVEYRITSDSGDLRWVCSRGRPYFHHDGSPARMLGVSLNISERKQLEENQKHHLAEIELLKQQIEQENYYLREDLKKVQGVEHVIGQSREFNAVLASARQVAPTSATVLLFGETGTGKDVIANAIHQMSGRSNKPFVTVNCAALPHNLIESELFGREKGAFTGAHIMQAGRFEVAGQGTIFLDEIGEMPMELQAKLLRVLQDGEFERLGSPRTVNVDVRVIAATSRDLRAEVKARRFREDLFYRLNVFPITIPPLRQRVVDIPLLAQHFIEKYCQKMGKEIDRIPKRAVDLMMNYQWPGNVRELEHLVERCVIISSGNTLALGERFFPSGHDAADGKAVKDLESNERDHITEVLGLTNWKIEGPGGAASILDIHPSTLRFRLKKLGIKRPV